jgi:Tfp pilus assembly protein PilN
LNTKNWVIGIMAVVLCVLMPPLTFVLGIALLVYGIRARRDKTRKQPMSLASIITGAALVVGLAVYVLLGLVTQTDVIVLTTRFLS